MACFPTTPSVFSHRIVWTQSPDFWTDPETELDMFLAKAAPRKNSFPSGLMNREEGSSVKREIRIIAPSRTWADLFVVQGSEQCQHSLPCDNLVDQSQEE
jgi:hypothetical protein